MKTAIFTWIKIVICLLVVMSCNLFPSSDDRAHLYVFNGSDYTITGVYLRDTGDVVWGENLITENLLPNESMKDEFDPGTFDVRITYLKELKSDERVSSEYKIGEGKILDIQFQNIISVYSIYNYH